MRPEATVRAPAGRTLLPFERVAARHRDELVAYLTRVLGSRADAEDACHDALLRAQRAYPTLHDHARVRAWLFLIATRTAANLRRGQRRRAARASGIDPETLPAETPPRSLDRALRAAVETLPVRQRAALMLRIFHDHDYAQIGAIMACSADTARANVYQAIRRLKSVLRPSKGKQP